MIINNDCLMALKELPENSVDAIITDPPYGLSFMGKKWDYDVPSVEIWAECLRVLKPGGYLLAFAGTRTQHRMAVRIEDAGFEIRDMIAWIYGSGFPKSLNIGKVMDKYLKTGNASWNGTGDSSNGALGYSKLQHNQGYRPADYSNKHQNKEEITEDLAKKWEGWGTATKPAVEPVTIGAKPLLLSHIFAILSLDITNKLWQKLNANVSDVEQTLKSIQLLLEKAGVNSVHENARMLSWENIESVAIAAASSTLPKPTLNEQTEGNKELFVITNVNQTGNDNLQENQTQIGKEGSLSEQMDMLLSILVTSNIDLNTILLWKNILEDVLQRANTFTISTALKMITGWKTCNFLLSANIQNFTSNNVKISPNCEPITVARKPLSENTVAENCLKWGVGGINIDGCRVEATGKDLEQLNSEWDREWSVDYSDYAEKVGGKAGFNMDKAKVENKGITGRFPANLILSYPENEYILKDNITDEQREKLTLWLQQNH